MKNILSIFCFSLISIPLWFTAPCLGLDFYDDFQSGLSDAWLIAEKQWGGDNGGVVHQNISVTNGSLFLWGNGDRYTGDVYGVNHDGHPVDRKTRVGAAIATSNYFASGRYEVRMKLPAQIGSCSAIWTFHYEEAYQGSALYTELAAEGFKTQGNANDGYYIVRNHEIDIETPTGLKTDLNNISYTNGRFNSWIGECSGEFTDPFVSTGSAMNDGLFHIFRFDWHTGSATNVPHVEYYIDDRCIVTNLTHVPTIAGRLWLGIWFPTWTGTPDFDRQALEIDWVKITSWNESGDERIPETCPDSGWWIATPEPTITPTSLPTTSPPPAPTSTPAASATQTNTLESIWLLLFQGQRH